MEDSHTNREEQQPQQEKQKNSWFKTLANWIRRFRAAILSFIGLILASIADKIADWLTDLLANLSPEIILFISIVAGIALSAAAALAVYNGLKKAHLAQRIFIACSSGLFILAVVLCLCYLLIIQPPLPPKLEYVDGVEVSLYAGYVDGELSEDTMTAYEFSHPESLAVCDGVVYVTGDSNTGDGISLLELDRGLVASIPLDNYTAELVHVCQDNVYVLATKEEQDGSQFACILLVSGSDYKEIMEPLPMTEDPGVQEQIIADFTVTDNGKCLWLIVGNLSENENRFALRKMIHEYDDQQKDFYRYSEEKEMEILITASLDRPPRIIADSSDNLYVSLPESNLIRVKEHDAVTFRDFVGVEGDANFNDRGTPTFHSPTSLATDSQYLYVLDSDVLSSDTSDENMGRGTIRRISLKKGAHDVKTLAGNIEGNGTALEHYDQTLSGQDAILTKYGNSNAFIAVLKDGVVLLSDPTKYIIYKIWTD